MLELEEYLVQLGYEEANEEILLSVNEQLDPTSEVEFLVNRYPLPAELQVTIDRAHQRIQKAKSAAVIQHVKRALSKALLEHFQDDPCAEEYIRKQRARQEKLNLLYSQRDDLEGQIESLESKLASYYV